MAIDKIQSESINLADTFAFTGTVTGAGENNNPAFRAGLTSGAVGLGTSGGYTQIPCNNEIFDQGGCYNNTGSTVTLNGLSAPAYSFCPNKAGK